MVDSSQLGLQSHGSRPASLSTPARDLPLPEQRARTASLSKSRTVPPSTTGSGKPSEKPLSKTKNSSENRSATPLGNAAAKSDPHGPVRSKSAAKKEDAALDNETGDARSSQLNGEEASARSSLWAAATDLAPGASIPTARGEGPRSESPRTEMSRATTAVPSLRFNEMSARFDLAQRGPISVQLEGGHRLELQGRSLDSLTRMQLQSSASASSVERLSERLSRMDVVLEVSSNGEERS